MLRTVSFSDKRVADRVNSKFVAAWINRGPGFMNTEFWTESDIAQNHYEAYPTKNICTFFVSPEGKVFFYAAGSYSPEFFLKILDTAWSLRTALFNDRMETKADGAQEASRIHQKLSEDYQDAKEETDRAESNPQGWRSVVGSQRAGNYRGLKHVHGPACLWSLREGYEYLALLHRHWSNLEELPGFNDVKYKYLYGNDFSEETADAPRITRPDPTVPSKAPVKLLKPAQCSAQKFADPLGIGLFGNLMENR